MTQTFEDYMTGRPARPFEAKPQYFIDGDFVSCFLSDQLAYEERLDGLVTVYRSVETNEMVGCKIKGVKLLLQDFGGFLVIVKEAPFSLALLFMKAAQKTTADNVAIYREMIEKLGRKEITLPLAV